MAVLNQQFLHVLLCESRHVRTQALLGEHEEQEPVNIVVLAHHDDECAVEGIRVEDFSFFEVWIRRC